MTSRWQDHQKMGMQAFLNGDNDEAIKHWRIAACAAEEAAAMPSTELADLYYCLGKSLADLKVDDEAERYLRGSVEMLTDLMPDNQKLKVAQYALGEVLNRGGRGAEADKQFKLALNLPERVNSFVPLKDAIKELQTQKLCKDLKGGELRSLCHQLKIDPDSDNSRITELLLTYYSDANNGVDRIFKDRFFMMHCTEFDVDDTISFLNGITGEDNLFILEHAEGDTADGDILTMTLKRIDGQIVYRACQSVVGLVDEYNSALDHLGKPRRFCSFGDNAFFAAYFMEPKVQRQLHETGALSFDEVFTD